MSKDETFKKYIDSMKTFVEKYNDDLQVDSKNYEDCGGKYKPIIQR